VNTVDQGQRLALDRSCQFHVLHPRQHFGNQGGRLHTLEATVKTDNEPGAAVCGGHLLAVCPYLPNKPGTPSRHGTRRAARQALLADRSWAVIERTLLGVRSEIMSPYPATPRPGERLAETSQIACEEAFLAVAGTVPIRREYGCKSGAGVTPGWSGLAVFVRYRTARHARARPHLVVATVEASIRE